MYKIPNNLCGHSIMKEFYHNSYKQYYKQNHFKMKLNPPCQRNCLPHQCCKSLECLKQDKIIFGLSLSNLVPQRTVCRNGNNKNRYDY